MAELKQCPDEQEYTYPRLPTASLTNVSTGAVYHLQPKNQTIGRTGGRCDMLVGKSPMVSRLHCRIFYCNGIWKIEDLDSYNGTFVNGHRLVPWDPVDLQDGDMIKLADVLLRFAIY